jgi:hypothetical protein
MDALSAEIGNVHAILTMEKDWKKVNGARMVRFIERYVLRLFKGFFLRNGSFTRESRVRLDPRWDPRVSG